MGRNMIIGIEWGRRSIAYERLWDIADVLGVDLPDLFTSPSNSSTRQPQRKGRVRSNPRAGRSAGPDAQ